MRNAAEIVALEIGQIVPGEPMSIVHLEVDHGHQLTQGMVPGVLELGLVEVVVAAEESPGQLERYPRIGAPRGVPAVVASVPEEILLQAARARLTNIIGQILLLFLIHVEQIVHLVLVRQAAGDLLEQGSPAYDSTAHDPAPIGGIGARGVPDGYAAVILGVEQVFVAELELERGPKPAGGGGQGELLGAAEQVVFGETQSAEQLVRGAVSAGQLDLGLPAVVDGDGDIDALSASYYDQVAWYENKGGTPPTFVTHIIATPDGAQSVYAADLDGDSDLDVLVAAMRDDAVIWYENDGNCNFTTHVVTTNADEAHSVYAIDLDNDGDVDLYTTAYFPDHFIEHSHAGGLPTGVENFVYHDSNLGGSNILLRNDVADDRWDFMDVTEQVVEQFVAQGADIIELGIPFSDPMADGPTIHNSLT